MSQPKVGIILAQLGTPEAPTPRALRPYRLRADDIVITPVDVGRDLEYGRD